MKRVRGRMARARQTRATAVGNVSSAWNRRVWSRRLSRLSKENPQIDRVVTITPAETAAQATSLMRRPPGAELLLMANGLVATAPPGGRLALVPPGFLIQSVVRPGSCGPISLDRILRARNR